MLPQRPLWNTSTLPGKGEDEKSRGQLDDYRGHQSDILIRSITQCGWLIDGNYIIIIGVSHPGTERSVVRDVINQDENARNILFIG